MLPPENANLDLQVYMANKYRIKPGPPTLTPSSRSEDEQFFEYVRQGKYKQAYVMGQHIMEKRPNNKSIANFCQYILKNMLEDQNQSQSASQSGSSQEQSESSDQSSEESSQEEQQSALSGQQTQQGEKESSQSSFQQKTSQQQDTDRNAKKPAKMPVNFNTPKMKTIPKAKVENRYHVSPEIPKLALTENTNHLNTDKQSLKNFINIRFNSEKQHQKQKRYTEQSNFKKSSLKLPIIQNMVINQKKQPLPQNKENGWGRKNSENLFSNKSGTKMMDKTHSNITSKRTSLNLGQQQGRSTKTSKD